MNWLSEKLKDKKNLPIIVGIAVFFVLAAAGLIALELGAFSGSTTTAAVPPSSSGPRPPGSLPPGAPGSLPPGAPNAPGGFPSGPTGVPPPFGAARPALTATALTTAPGLNEALSGSKNPNPTGPNPYAIPNGRKLLAQRTGPVVGALPLRERLPRLDLYRLPPPAAPAQVSTNPYGGGGQNGLALASNYRLSGIVNGADGNINGILEVGGQSQTVKPGDLLPDGSRVESITGTSLILRTSSGTPLTISLSNGTDANGGGNPGGNPGYPGQGFPGNGPNYPGQGFPGQNFPGQGFPGQGFPGQGQGFPGADGASDAQPQNF